MNIPMIDRNDPKTDGMIHRKQAPERRGYVPNTLDEETRSVEVVAATENPSEVYDPNRWEVVTEVLLMSGCQIPDEGQVPLTIDHYRGADAVIGSLREMRIENDELLGRVFFAGSPDAEPYWIKVKEGHLDRFSVTYPADDRDSVYVADGETAVIEGKRYEGPILVTKRWTPKALGLVVFGADKDAKARGETNQKPNSNKEVNAMNEKLRKYLERCGLKKDATEAEAWAFLERLQPAQVAPENPPAGGTATGDGAGDPPPDPDNGGDANRQAVDPETIRREAARAVESERLRVVEIRAMCERHNCADLADEMIRDGVEIDAARQRVLDHLATADNNPQGAGFRPAMMVADERDKFREAAEHALLMRSAMPGLKIEKPAPGASDLMGFSLVEIARHSLMLANQPIGGNRMEMIGRALISSDLPYLLANVANKALFTGWETAEETWQVWCGTGSVSDFKTHYSPRISEADDLDEIPEHGRYKYGKRTEAQEQYQIATYGKIFAVTRQTIINDDLGALTNIPASHGEAAARKIGDVVYAVLTANAAMGDGIALFHSSHSNLGTAGAVGTTTIAELIKQMKQQKDLRNLRRLNIRPEFFIGPTSIEGSAEVFFRAEKWDDTAKDATRPNPYAGNYFTRVYEARLDDDSTTAYYLAARKGKTIVVYFLNGVQEPYLETKEGWTVDGVEYKVRIDCGAKAMDWRGLQKNAGA